MNTFNRNDSKQYFPQRLSRKADFKIRAKIFMLFVRNIMRNAFASPAYSAVALAFCLVLFFTGTSMLRTYSTKQFLSEVQAIQAERNDRIKTEIFERKFLVTEGKGKAAFVAAVKNIPIEDAARVPLRRDTVEEWHYGISNMSYVDTNIPEKPVDVRLNLENKDHMHVFEYQPRNCTAQKKANITSEGCGQKAQATDTTRAHRKLFDGVHDIATLYSDELAYNLSPNIAIDVNGLEYRGDTEEDGLSMKVFAQKQPDTEILYYFDARTHELIKRVVVIVKDGKSYEMSEIVELESSFIPATESARLFDPKRFGYIQKEVIPLDPALNS